ncbi:cytochrome-c peroxidase, partial [Castellaniella sp.]|uniref:cytochrome-c peroxidase n=1 Tax=Castellaniella sp. TaxID=1955812 RepID=UPI00356611C9
MTTLKTGIAVLFLALGCASVVQAQSNEPVEPIPYPEAGDAAKIELGKMLFFDPRLSRSGFISCNSCHNLSTGGSDNLATSIGDQWQQGPINSPTVLNSALNMAQFWDGRADTLRDQAGGPIANPMEMAFTHELAVELLASIPQYVDAFENVYHTPEITIDEVTDAIAAFEETLVTPDAPFDLWLKGDSAALSEQALAGYQLFKASGCIACHNGPNLGGRSFQKMGLIEPYKTDNPAEGRSAVTGKDADRFSFKVPTLRNVELTYPYFHDGAVDTLAEAVDIMGRLQLGRHY